MQLSCGRDPQWTAFNQPIYNLQDIASERQHITHSKEYYLVMQAYVVWSCAVISYISKFAWYDCMNARPYARRKISTNPFGWLEGNWTGKSNVGAELSNVPFRRNPSRNAFECTRGHYANRYAIVLRSVYYEQMRWRKGTLLQYL